MALQLSWLTSAGSSEGGREEATGKGSLVIKDHLWPSLAPACSVTHWDYRVREGAVHSSGTSSGT